MTPRFYKMRQAKGSAFSGLKVWHGPSTDPVTGEALTERSPIWRCELNGNEIAAEDVAIEFDHATGAPIIKGEPCDEIEYLKLAQTYQWAKTYAPDDPAANPTKKINLFTAALPW